MGDPRQQRLAALALFFGASIWGLYWVPLRELNRMGLQGSWAVAFFNFCPLIILLPMVALRWRMVMRRPWPAAFIGAASGIGLGLYSTSIILAPVIRMTMEFYLTSIWSTIIGVLWLSERLDMRRVLSVALGLTGLFLLLSGGQASGAGALTLGDAMALASGVLWAFGAAGIKRWPEAPVIVTSAFQFLFAVGIAVLLGVLMLPTPAPTAAQLTHALPIAFLASNLLLLPSVFAIFWACRVLYPGRAAILMMSEAVVATLSASWFLPDEVMSPVQWTGAAIVLLACLLG